MRMYDIIEKKRNGEFLTKEEIEFVINGYTSDKIPDYQMSALLMAVYIKGMNDEGILNLTMAMANSGEKLNLSQIRGIKVDKHSTGGVGDKTTLVLGPMVAACGVPVAKMSGRGLGHTGGTIDKLESIKGFKTQIPTEQFIKNVNENGIAIVGQTKNLAPADKKLYALRDVTATVSSIPLIASSIMSKKLASGADAIVLDVKVGSGAFMKTEEDAIKLATEMVKIGNGAGRETVAVISDMNQPLGNNVGNSLEVIEAIEALKGNGPEDLMELCYTLGSYMLILGGVTNNVSEAKEMLKDSIESRRALKKFKTFVKAQGGSAEFADNTELFEKSIYEYKVFAEHSGFVSNIECESIGKASLVLGAGRESKESDINLNVGIKILKKVGDKVSDGDIISIIYADDEVKMKEAANIVKAAFDISETVVLTSRLIKCIITKDGIEKY